jgi:hypothetical protein
MCRNAPCASGGRSNLINRSRYEVGEKDAIREMQTLLRVLDRDDGGRFEFPAS